MINRHTKFEVSTIPATKIFIKGNAKYEKNSRFEPPFGNLGVTHGVHLWLGGKRIVDFLLMIIKHFSLALTGAALLSEICRNRRFLKRWVTLTQILGRWGRRPQSIYGPLDRGMM